MKRSDRELATSRALCASVESVFDAFRDPAKLARWWGPRGFTNTIHDFDFRPGGAWKLTMHGPDGKDYANELRFGMIEEPRRLELEHVSKPRYVAEFLMEPAPEGSRIEFYQRFDSAETCRRIAKFAGPANEENLDRLQALLAELAAARDTD